MTVPIVLRGGTGTIQFEDGASLFKMKFGKLRYHIMLNTIIMCALAFGVKNGTLRPGYSFSL